MPGLPAGQSMCSGRRLTIIFMGMCHLFERSSLNIKVSVSEDMLDNFKVLWLLCREVLFLCFLQLVCFWLHCEVDDKDSEFLLHHEPVLCTFQFKDTERDQTILTGWRYQARIVQRLDDAEFLFSIWTISWFVMTWEAALCNVSKPWFFFMFSLLKCTFQLALKHKSFRLLVFGSIAHFCLPLRVQRESSWQIALELCCPASLVEGLRHSSHSNQYVAFPYGSWSDVQRTAFIAYNGCVNVILRRCKSAAVLYYWLC